MISLSEKHMQEVTAEGIRYVDEQGQTQFIDFAACYDNYWREQTNQEYWERFKKLNNLTDADWDAYIEHLKQWKVVGIRNYAMAGDPSARLPSFIVFFTNPHTRIEFEDVSIFSKVIYSMMKAKWRTIDGN